MAGKFQAEIQGELDRREILGNSVKNDSVMYILTLDAYFSEPD